MQREPAPMLAAGERLALGDFVLDLARGELLDASGRADLRAQALKLLLVLGERAGQVVGKDELLRRVWGDVVVTEDSLVQAVGDIRRVLGDARHTRLRTIPRRGYLLVAPEPMEAPLPAAAAPSRAAWAAGLAALALVIMALVVWLLPREAPVSNRSLAIMPFESEPPDAGDAWFADAITGDLNTMVARWEAGLKLIGRGTMQRYKGQGADPRDVGRELGVAQVLTGRVRREGERVHIAVEIVDTASGRVLWARPFDVNRTELPSSIGDIAGGIEKALVIEIGDVVTDHGRRLDAAQADADDLAMRGFSLYLKGLSADTLMQSRQLFEQAVARDPKSMRGLGGLSLTHSMEVSFAWSKDEAESLRRSQASLARLEAIDAHAHMTLLARASHLLSSSDWAGQFAVSEELIRHFPNEPTSYHHRCSSLLRLGRFDDAIPACERAIRISPNESRTPIWNGLIGMNEFMRGNYKAAAERARVTATANANLPFYALLVAVALQHAGRTDEAKQVFAEVRAKHPAYDTRRIEAGWKATNVDPKFLAGRGRIIATARELGLP